jgi:hypothetical protein
VIGYNQTKVFLISFKSATYFYGWLAGCYGLPPAGRMLGIETKSKDGTLRPAQIRCHAWLRDAGALLIVPRTVEEVAAALIAQGIRHQALSREA